MAGQGGGGEGAKGGSGRGRGGRDGGRVSAEEEAREAAAAVRKVRSRCSHTLEHRYAVPPCRYAWHGCNPPDAAWALVTQQGCGDGTQGYVALPATVRSHMALKVYCWSF